MNNITDYLVEKSNGLLKVIPEISNPASGYHCFDETVLMPGTSIGGSVEVEVAEFLYSLVHLMKPMRILETGTHVGISSAYMGQACKEITENYNSTVHLVITLEYLMPWRIRAVELHRILGVDNYIASFWEDSRKYVPSGSVEYDILFLDSEPQYRWEEFDRFYPYVRPGGIILIHDLHRGMSYNPNAPEEIQAQPTYPFWPFGEFRDSLVRLQGEISYINFGTPRGLTMIYKNHPNDNIHNFFNHKDLRI